MAEKVGQQLPQPARRIHVVPNAADTINICPVEKHENAFAGAHRLRDITVLYAGNVGANHGIDQLVRAAKLLEDDIRVDILIVGEGLGMERVVAARNDLGPTNLSLLPPQSWDVVPKMLAAGDIAVVSQEPGTEDLSMPSKTYSSLAAGSAILALTSEDSDLGSLILKSEVGAVCADRSPEAIAAAIRRLASDERELSRIRSNARQLAEREFSEDAVTAQWRVLLQEAWGDVKSRSPNHTGDL